MHARSRIAQLVVLLVVVPLSAAHAGRTFVVGPRQGLSQPSAPLVAPSISKIDIALRGALADPMRRDDRHRIAKRGQSGRGFVVVEQSANGSTVFPVFVESRNVAQTLIAIRALGGSVSTTTRSVLVARLAPETVESIAGRNEVVRIEGSYRDSLKMDLSRADIRADQVYAGISLPNAFKGAGVVVGVVDSGIDWTHSDFKNASGQTRILSIWDQTTSGKPPSGYSVGYECTAANINASQCPERDTNTHGTHVAGIAAGNGRSRSGAPLRGIAPEADLIIVKTDLSEANIIAGVDYIFKRAQALGKPAVVNLSLAGHVGPHDGTSSYERTLSDLTGAGKLVAAANSNEGNSRIHMGYNAQGTSYSTGISTLVNAEKELTLIDLWYNSGVVSVGLRANLVVNGQLQKLDELPAISTGQTARRALTDGGTIIGYASIETEARPEGGRHVFVAIDNNETPSIDLSKIVWELYTFGSGRIDGWTTKGVFDALNQPSDGFIGGDTSMTVGMPATANNVIAVGAYVTRPSWVDVDGQTRAYDPPVSIGAISSFSSLGPTRDGRRRPSISAPGQAIVSTLSSTPEENAREYFAQGGSYRIEQGTSQASPHVTGLLALMLQARSSLGVSEALSILQGTARKDGNTGGSANNTFGDGKIDALAAVQAIAGTGTVTPPPGNGAALRLLNGRFEITLAAKDTGRSNKSGNGVPIAEPGNNLFGYFSIPDLTGDAGNPEVFIKVLDVGGGKYWVFYSGLTDLEYTLTVRDTATGKSKAYKKAIGSFCGDADTSFSTFPGGTITVLSVVEKPLLQFSSNAMPLASIHASLSDRLGVAAKAQPAGLNTVSEARVIHPTANCSSALNLFASRFSLTMAAQDPRSGGLGCGLALPKTDIFGYYSIPDLTSNPSNPEVFTKMLDARQFDNGNFWIFVGRLTDFSVALRVDDRQTQKSFLTDPPMPGGNLCGAVYVFKP